MQELKLENKVAVITGGNSGIDLATARLFKEQGASLVIVGRNNKTLENVKDELGDDTIVIKLIFQKFLILNLLLKHRYL